MDRKEFLQNSLIIGGATLLPSNSIFATSVKEGGIDKLTDENGNFIQQALPYTESFLEPYMDAETMHLHYTFHHGGAVKASNNDLKKSKIYHNAGVVGEASKTAFDKNSFKNKLPYYEDFSYISNESNSKFYANEVINAGKHYGYLAN